MTDYFKLANTIDTETVLTLLGVEYKTTGPYWSVKCPYHGGEDFFKLKGVLDKGVFTCNVCSEKGDMIKLAAKYLDCAPRQAAIWLCEKTGLVSASGEVQEVTIPKPKGKPKKAMAPSEVLDLVYNEVVAVLADLPTGKQREDLRERGLPETLWTDLFDYPSWKKKNLLSKVVENLENLGVTKEVLGTVPGFTVDGDKVEFYLTEGLGLLQRNRKGEVHGLQIRVEKPRNGGKYKVASSGWTPNGISAGAVWNFVPANPQKQRGFAITEGTFKAKVLAEVFHYDTLSLNGVGTFKQVLAREDVSGYDDCTIFFDADWKINKGVKDSLLGLIRELTKLGLHKNVYVAIWDENLGKGIDDVIVAGNLRKISRITAKEFVETYG